MTELSYFTVQEDATHEIEIQKSRFIAHIQRVTSEADAGAFIEAINKSHWKANHNCYAYVIGENNRIQKASDNGEPSGTAGVPILEVLKKRELRDTIAIITRYFGGTKLGAGGLIRAYSKSTSEGIEAAGIVERSLGTVMHVTTAYTQLGHIENQLRASSYLIKDIHYTDEVTFDVFVKSNETDVFVEWMTNLSNGDAKLFKGNDEFLEKSV